MPGLDPLPALHQRLAAAAAALQVHVTPEGEDLGAATSILYAALVDRVHAEAGTDGLWLLMTALAAALPDSDELLAARRSRDLREPEDFARWLLEGNFGPASARGSVTLEMDVVVDTVVVDVDFTAQNTLHTGIQRVVRETAPRWDRDHEITLVSWTAEDGAMRRLTPRESDRVLRWHELTSGDPEDDTAGARPRIVVPWRCTVVLPEIPPPEHCAALAAMARFSGNQVTLVGHDCIPVISSDLIHESLPDRFARFLETVKHAHRVAGVSASAAREFQGFVSMLPSQGLAGPDVVRCPLPMETPPADPVPAANPPLVVAIGSFEPRKNQLAVLHAAEQLWREGLTFQLRFIGGGGYVTEADAFMRRLVAAGRQISRLTAISDAELWHSLRSARFSVFVSLHEGFGLPVVESLACGTPCLTSDHGSMLEIAEQGGALVVDPTDDQAVADQMRRLLTDDELIGRLRREALERPRRTWDDYARELWEALVVPSRTPAEVSR